MGILKKMFGNNSPQPEPQKDKRAEAEKIAMKRRLQTLQMQIEVIRRDYQ